MSHVLAFPKPVRLKYADYLRFIRRQPCLFHHVASEAHHAGPGGMGTKCGEHRTVPLCFRHHRQLHNHGRKWFEEKHQVNLDLEEIRFLEMFLSALRDGENLGALR